MANMDLNTCSQRVGIVQQMMGDRPSCNVKQETSQKAVIVPQWRVDSPPKAKLKKKGLQGHGFNPSLSSNNTFLASSSQRSCNKDWENKRHHYNWITTKDVGLQLQKYINLRRLRGTTTVKDMDSSIKRWSARNRLEVCMCVYVVCVGICDTKGFQAMMTRWVD